MRSAIIGQCCIATCPSKFSNLGGCFYRNIWICPPTGRWNAFIHSFIPWLLLKMVLFCRWPVWILVFFLFSCFSILWCRSRWVSQGRFGIYLWQFFKKCSKFSPNISKMAIDFWGNWKVTTFLHENFPISKVFPWKKPGIYNRTFQLALGGLGGGGEGGFSAMWKFAKKTELYITVSSLKPISTPNLCLVAGHSKGKYLLPDKRCKRKKLCGVYHCQMEAVFVFLGEIAKFFPKKWAGHL
jgi:hypothetical protein